MSVGQGGREGRRNPSIPRSAEAERDASALRIIEREREREREREGERDVTVTFSFEIFRPTVPPTERGVVEYNAQSALAPMRWTIEVSSKFKRSQTLFYRIQLMNLVQYVSALHAVSFIRDA